MCSPIIGLEFSIHLWVSFSLIFHFLREWRTERRDFSDLGYLWEYTENLDEESVGTGDGIKPVVLEKGPKQGCDHWTVG